MGVLTWMGLRESADTTALRETAAAATSEVEILRESLADLELALEDEGWQRLTTGAEHEFTRDGLARAAQVARVMAVANPLIKRGLNMRQAYVFGQGVQVQARANGDDGAQDVNAIVQAFLDDEGNRAALTGDQAQEELERALGTDGNVFIACFTSPMTGFVQARSIPFDEITDVITNPDDRDDPWLYRRQWVQRVVNDQGRLVQEQRTAFYPALTYRPRVRAKTVDGHEVHWDAPIHHVSVNRLDGWSFGIGDAYAALAWARAYRDFLADWAVLVKALSQFAWRASSKGSKAQALRQKLARRPATGDAPAGNQNSVGATAVTGPDVTLEAIPKTGATIDSESGRPLAAMVAAALDIPVTTLLSDPGQTGARAVAETLNLPTRLAMQQRRSLWASAYRSILGYVILQAAKAPRGPLRGTVMRDGFTGREVLNLTGDTDSTIEIEWPPLDEIPVETVVAAIVSADSTGKMPPEQTVKLLLQALGVKDVDEILADFLDEDGRFVDPYTSAGQAAVAAFRRGEDPAAVV
jgi:hypothetical protein